MYLVRVHCEAGSELGYRAVATNRGEGCFRLEVGGLRVCLGMEYLHWVGWVGTRLQSCTLKAQ